MRAREQAREKVAGPGCSGSGAVARPGWRSVVGTWREGWAPVLEGAPGSAGGEWTASPSVVYSVHLESCSIAALELGQELAQADAQLPSTARTQNNTWARVSKAPRCLQQAQSPLKPR